MLAGSLSIFELSEAHLSLIVRGWKAKLSHNTVYNYRRVLKRIARQIGSLTARPLLHEAIPKIGGRRARQTIATPQDIAALVTAAPAWLRCAILLAAHAGFRRSDILRIAPRHFDAAHSTITIEQAKTGKEVTVPVTSELAAILGTLTDDNPSTPILELLKGTHVTKQTLGHSWNRLKRKCGVSPDLWLHDLRRTLAVSLYEISKDLRVVEQMLGHQSLAATVQYLEHRDPTKLKPYLDSIHTIRTRFIQ